MSVYATKGLAASRWASDLPAVTSWPRPPPSNHYNGHSLGQNYPFQHQTSTSSSTVTSTSTVQPSSREQLLSRFLKISARMKWKIPFLEIGYELAVDRLGRPEQEVAANEIHFKLDFHEFYMLIERALVHLMEIFGITIERVGGGGGGPRISNELRTQRDRYEQHRYHENVLRAMDSPANPLHEMLGRPDVLRQFFRAKELRNRWKHADDDDSGRVRAPQLESYNLKEILSVILAALEQAYFFTDQYVRSQSTSVGVNGNGHVNDNGSQPVSMADWTTDSDDWEFMVDAMDWEAV
ncbi:hypothetical protein F4808DRAFT_272352 [Astrocystis sublimbata]|nr:hypothetical protein F4808DRAFT_272352 [Astrocystis sublimbata]